MAAATKYLRTLRPLRRRAFFSTNWYSVTNQEKNLVPPVHCKADDGLREKRTEAWMSLTQPAVEIWKRSIIRDGCKGEEISAIKDNRDSISLTKACLDQPLQSSFSHSRLHFESNRWYRQLGFDFNQPQRSSLLWRLISGQSQRSSDLWRLIPSQSAGLEASHGVPHCNDDTRWNSQTVILYLFSLLGLGLATIGQVSADDGSTTSDKECKGQEPGLDDHSTTFAPVHMDELMVTDPIEMSSAGSLSHQHLVQQAAGVAAEAALVCTMRACSALLAAMHQHRRSLHHLLELHQYHLALAEQVAKGSAFERLLEQVTEATVGGRADAGDWRRRCSDLQLLVRVSAQALDNLSLCSHIAGAASTALVAGQGLEALRAQVEALEHELRQLQAEVVAAEADVIAAEKQQQQRQKTSTQQDAAGDDGERNQQQQESTGSRSQQQHSAEVSNQQLDEQPGESQVVPIERQQFRQHPLLSRFQTKKKEPPAADGAAEDQISPSGDGSEDSSDSSNEKDEVELLWGHDVDESSGSAEFEQLLRDTQSKEEQEEIRF